MQDNFNLTGWVRNKRLLKESSGDSQSFDWEPLSQNGNGKRGNFPVTINNDTAIVYDQTNSRPIARFTKDDLKGVQDGGYVGTTLGGYQLNNSDELKKWAMGGDEEMNEEEVDESNDLYSTFPSFDNDTDNNEDQSAWERFYEEGYLAGYKACQNRQPNRFAKGEQPVSDYQAMRNSEKY